MRFQKQVVVISGAGSGIGAATAKLFYDEGALVVLVGRDKKKLDDTAREFETNRHTKIAADVSLEDDVEHIVSSTVENFGKLDVLVNNAAVAAVGGFLDHSFSDWQRMMAINVGGIISLSRAALPHLVASHGAIVNISSISGLGGDRGLSLYNTTKGAVSNLTRSLALEFGPQGVRINAVCPGVTFTEMNRPFFESSPELLKAQLERIPLGRGAHPSEIATVIAFLASNEASFVNGINLPVDGGGHASSGLAPCIS